MLLVYWKWNKKAWVTQEVFTNCYIQYFCPTVFQFYKERNLSVKVLILDNSPGHPQNLAEIKTLLDVKVVYAIKPPNTTSILQSMDQKVSIHKKQLKNIGL